MSEKLSLDLDQYPLGRKFLFQSGLQRARASARVSVKRSATRKTSKTVKRRKLTS